MSFQASIAPLRLNSDFVSRPFSSLVSAARPADSHESVFLNGIASELRRILSLAALSALLRHRVLTNKWLVCFPYPTPNALKTASVASA